jgi:hypothetical protein
MAVKAAVNDEFTEQAVMDHGRESTRTQDKEEQGWGSLCSGTASRERVSVTTMAVMVVVPLGNGTGLYTPSSENCEP